jgi:uncharacterized membrane protein
VSAFVRTPSASAWRYAVWAVAVLHGFVTLTLSLTRFHTGKAAMLDMGFYDQAIWTAATAGTPTISMYPPYHIQHFFTLHVVPLVLLVAPIYPKLPIEGLIVLQSALVSLSAVIVFHAVTRLKVSPGVAFAWTLVYLLNPFLLNGSVWDFRERSMALPLFAAAFLGLYARRPALFTAALVGLTLCEEQFGLAVCGFGVLWAREHGRDRVATYTVAGGLVALVMAASIMGGLKSAGESTPWVGGSMHVARYSWLAQPSLWRPALREIVPQGMEYVLFFLAAPLAGLSLLSPFALLPGVADLGANLLSLNPMPRSIHAYHSMTLVPVFLIAAVRTSVRWLRPGLWAAVALAVTVPFSYIFFPAPLPGAVNVWKMGGVAWHRDAEIDDIARMVPSSMSASVQSGVGAFFSRRTRVYIFPALSDQVDAVILHLEYPYGDRHYSPFAIPYRADGQLGTDDEDRPVLPAVERLLADSRYGVVYWRRHWLVAIRGATDRVDRRQVQARVAELRATPQVAFPSSR